MVARMCWMLLVTVALTNVSRNKIRVRPWKAGRLFRAVCFLPLNGFDMKKILTLILSVAFLAANAAVIVTGNSRNGSEVIGGKIYCYVEYTYGGDMTIVSCYNCTEVGDISIARDEHKCTP